MAELCVSASYLVSTLLNARCSSSFCIGLQYFTFRLIKHMVDGRISGVQIIKFQIRGIPRPQLLDPQTVDRVRKQQQLMSIND